MRTQRSLVHVMLGATVITYWGWGALGIVAGGALIHRLGRNDPRWQVWLVAIATLFGTCASIGLYMASSLTTATLMLWLFVPVAYLNLAPILSLTQSLVPPRMRGLSCAIMLFGANMANLALAPQIIGVLSDAFLAHSSAGPESLRWALILTTFTGFWAVFHFWAAGRHMQPDLERAGAQVGRTVD
jgi:hypothetical protein